MHFTVLNWKDRKIDIKTGLFVKYYYSPLTSVVVLDWLLLCTIFGSGLSGFFSGLLSGISGIITDIVSVVLDDDVDDDDAVVVVI